ncbi:hypothetical protein MMC14_004583 [Varicellaria rhodocarpa]|nr:hypothetical protein [Varicellaria rhodocarpa]
MSPCLILHGYWYEPLPSGSCSNDGLRTAWVGRQVGVEVVPDDTRVIEEFVIVDEFVVMDGFTLDGIDDIVVGDEPFVELVKRGTDPVLLMVENVNPVEIVAEEFIVVDAEEFVIVETIGIDVILVIKTFDVKENWVEEFVIDAILLILAVLEFMVLLSVRCILFEKPELIVCELLVAPERPVVGAKQIGVHVCVIVLVIGDLAARKGIIILADLRVEVEEMKAMTSLEARDFREIVVSRVELQS